jgi:hypothetical protein
VSRVRLDSATNSGSKVLSNLTGVVAFKALACIYPVCTYVVGTSMMKKIATSFASILCLRSLSLSLDRKLDHLILMGMAFLMFLSCSFMWH